MAYNKTIGTAGQLPAKRFNRGNAHLFVALLVLTLPRGLMYEREAKYKEFLAATCDTVSDWVVNDKIKRLLSKHMDEVLRLCGEYRKACKRNDEKDAKWFRTRTYQAHNRKVNEWAKNRQKNPLCAGERPKEPKRPDTLEPERLPTNPCTWFTLRPDHALTNKETLTRDYALLLIVHDVYIWRYGRGTRFIRPDLAKCGTFLDYIGWAGNWNTPIVNNPDLQPLIEEALRYVEEDLKRQGLLDGKTGDRTPPQKKTGQ